MTETQKQQRPLPYEWGVGWVAVQNEALTIYTLHPKFKGNTFLVYLYLLKNYNHRKGRSFPSYANMSRTLGIHEDTIGRCIETLGKLGMVNVHRLGGPQRYSFYYTFNPLLTDEEEFVRRFPEAQAKLEKRKEAQRKADEEKRRSEEAELIEWI